MRRLLVLIPLPLPLVARAARTEPSAEMRAPEPRKKNIGPDSSGAMPGVGRSF